MVPAESEIPVNVVNCGNEPPNPECDTTGDRSRRREPRGAAATASINAFRPVGVDMVSPRDPKILTTEGATPESDVVVWPWQRGDDVIDGVCRRIGVRIVESANRRAQILRIFEQLFRSLPSMVEHSNSACLRVLDWAS